MNVRTNFHRENKIPKSLDPSERDLGSRGSRSSKSYVREPTFNIFNPRTTHLSEGLYLKTLYLLLPPNVDQGFIYATYYRLQ